MIHAYDELYLERARSVMAHMLDYAVHGLGYELEDFFKLFLVRPKTGNELVALIRINRDSKRSAIRLDGFLHLYKRR